MIKSKEDPLDFVYSESDGDTGDNKSVRISDKGSKPREVVVDVQGVPTQSIPSDAHVPAVRVKLILSVCIPPMKSTSCSSHQ